MVFESYAGYQAYLDSMSDFPNSLDSILASSDWKFQRVATAVDGIFSEESNLYYGVPDLTLYSEPDMFRFRELHHPVNADFSMCDTYTYDSGHFDDDDSYDDDYGYDGEYKDTYDYWSNVDPICWK